MAGFQVTIYGRFWVTAEENLTHLNSLVSKIGFSLTYDDC
jgi:hypothetical protein